jgi:hypothetical protein
VIVLNSVRRWGPDVNARIGLAMAAGLSGSALKVHVFTGALDVPVPAVKVTRAEIRAYLKNAPRPCTVYRTLRESVQHVFQAAEPGDLLLLFGAQPSDPAAGMLRELIAAREGLAPDASPPGWVGMPEDELIREALLPSQSRVDSDPTAARGPTRRRT